ncbi:ATP-grasp fold amidoligase family protein [Butyrivibrio sp. NC2007]|uniref:ATP-grasp fold amidoligase family protein n=1 Tax=Butyrivibrio sp. NC2007 TaxID=1280683 RepID=UPI0003B58B49|nr:ATP-grasp fold amidoligase family protein [Butyrivibrio sp. NC2007]
MNIRRLVGLLRFIPDGPYLKIKYYYKMRKRLNLSNPTTFNEKIQWLKLHDRQNRYVTCVDKVKVKDYVSGIIGEKYIIPTLGTWKNFDDIDFEHLPDSFVIKTNHDSGGTFICRDKRTINKADLREKVLRHMKYDYYLYGREWPYKNVKKMILAEKLLQEDGKAIKDYKVFCFNGEPKLIQVDIDRFTEHKRNMYDAEWNLLEFQYQYHTAEDVVIRKPDNLNEMLEISKKLAEGTKFLRVDLYVVGGNVYFGEMTFYPESGFGRFIPDDWDDKLGRLLKL